MITRFALCIAVGGALLAGAAAAQEPDAERLALAEEVLEVAQAEQMVDQMLTQIQAMQSQITQQVAAAQGITVDTEIRSQVEAIMNEELRVAMEPLIDQLAPLYADVFTAEELQGLLDFYSTPAGKALIEKQPLLMERSIQVSTQWAQAAVPYLMQRVQQRVEKEVFKIEPAPGAL